MCSSDLVIVVKSGRHQAAAAAASSDKVALIIGNSNYGQLNRLNNTTNDARAIADALSQIGFETKLVINADESHLRKEIKEFSKTSARKSVSVVFYAGHGAQVEGENYILPTDFDIPRSESDVKLSGIKVDDLLLAIQSDAKIIFLDACRDNPILAKALSIGSRGIPSQQGLAPIKSDNTGDTNVFIAFATAAGSVAEDGNGSHSPFTQALLDNLKNPISIDDMFSLVTRQVT